MAETLEISQSTICHHLEKLRKVCKLGVWVLHDLSGENKESYRQNYYNKKYTFSSSNFISKHPSLINHENVMQQG